MARERIAYIDFMKCMCIMLIAMYHIDHSFFNYLAPNLNNALQAFRLPMYYFISGIFFKLYDGYSDFTRRKVNNILVPFVFFVVFGFVVGLVEYAARLLVGADPIGINLRTLIEPFYLRYWPNTAPIWFLLSLFWVNIIFYALQRWIKPLWGLVLAVFALSALGYWMGVSRIQLPWMMDSSLVAMPYFLLGWGVKRLGALEPTRYDKWGILALVAVALPIYYLSDFINLHSQAFPAYWKLYLLPYVAILSLFWACKSLPRIPVMCHYGRYSLIILGTHQLILIPIRSLFILKFGMEDGIELTLIVFVLTFLVEWPLIWLLKTYAPRFTAQEPFFKPGWKLR